MKQELSCGQINIACSNEMISLDKRFRPSVLANYCVVLQQWLHSVPILHSLALASAVIPLPLTATTLHARNIVSCFLFIL